ncbi:glycoside hydrolase family 43 protein [Mucilaginibacter sp. HMF5004]|uniref:glycoside hydrolase family 43 protein n=1 Tax=Mucilaginibacter rivuli TaxID=2857527 RepID=UPI001C5DDAF5|nr:glycoside hydrolase family 43 protein [Mucilaginibacter rivuli]MBW4888515.1 glycoside hydrolase family 43 protein [Mucilaginibacter rivuli]
MKRNFKLIRLIITAVILSPASMAIAQSSPKYLSQPLIKTIYTADPSAHVFNGKIYIYPSHDIDAGIPENDNGDHFAMRDYHILSMDNINGPVTDHGVALDIKNIPWAGRQLWAPDCAYKNGTYYLYFPVKDKNDVFHIGVATSKNPAGPFKAEPQPMKGSFSIDPAVFTDTDGQSYMYFGGIWGGQLQRWADGKYDANGSKTDLKKDDEPALSCKIAKLKPNMKEFDGPVKDITILDSNGKPLLGKDHNRRFFEGSWMHKYHNKYYFTYSTGDTHYLAYAIGDHPYGPFNYKGIFLKPVQGWTTHHSIVEFKGKWYMFYHDTQLSGKTHLRNIKVTPLTHNADGSIAMIDPFK